MGVCVGVGKEWVEEEWVGWCVYVGAWGGVLNSLFTRRSRKAGKVLAPLKMEPSDCLA